MQKGKKDYRKREFIEEEVVVVAAAAAEVEVN